VGRQALGTLKDFSGHLDDSTSDTTPLDENFDSDSDDGIPALKDLDDSDSEDESSDSSSDDEVPALGETDESDSCQSCFGNLSAR